MARKTNATVAVKVGDRVRLTKASRHGMVKAGEVGVVVEIRDEGNEYTDGISVEFMVKPSPYIAQITGQDPNVAKPHRCLYPKGCRLPFEVV